MARMREIAVALAIGVIAASCTNPLVPPPGRLDGAKTIGVISAIGDTFTYQTIGLVGFSERTTTGSIEDWTLDDLVIAAVRERLQETHTIIAPAVDPKDLEFSYLDFYSDVQKGGQRVERLVSAVGVRAEVWIVVQKMWEDNPNVPREHLRYGVGAQKTYTQLLGTAARPYLSVRVTYLDGESFAPLYSYSLCVASSIVGLPELPVGKITGWPAASRWDELDDERWQELRDVTTELLRRALAFSFSRLS